jgi:hypothetical protein
MALSLEEAESQGGPDFLSQGFNPAIRVHMKHFFI